MRTFGLTLLLFAAMVNPVHAMGSDQSSVLIAWNQDGSAALVENTSSRDGDHGRGYVVITATDPKLTAASISATTRAPAGPRAWKDVEQVPIADCAKAATTLATALAANHFVGVTVDPDACKRPGRKIIAVTADVTSEVERSWVALPQLRTPTARELAAWDVVKTISPTYQPVIAEAGCSGPNPVHEAIDIASRTDKLILVFSATTCNSPVRMKVRGFVRATGATKYTEKVWE